MTEVFQFLGIESTGPRADSAFEILDKDHSGRIEYSEFYDFFIIKLNPGPPPAPPKKTWKSHDYVRPGLPLATVNKIKGSFDLFDEDNSGDITFQEAMAGWKYLQKDLTDEEGQKKFKLIDKDGSGTIDWQEFFDFFAERAAESIRREKDEAEAVKRLERGEKMIDLLTRDGGNGGGGMEKEERDYHERLRSTMQHKESEEVSMTESGVGSTIVESRGSSFMGCEEIEAGGGDGDGAP